MTLLPKEYAFFRACAAELLCHEKVRCMREYHHHGKTNCLEHSIAVSYYSFWLCKRLHLNCDERSIIRGALLHDFFLYDWRDGNPAHKLHGFSHPKAALKNAQLYFMLNQMERDIIEKHMWPLTLKLPKYGVSVLVSLVDKLCAIAEFGYGIFGCMPYQIRRFRRMGMEYDSNC